MLLKLSIKQKQTIQQSPCANNPMQDKKIVNDFAAKLSKAKLLYDTTSSHCQKLRRQASQLQKQYQLIKYQRQSTEVLEQSLRQQLEHAKEINRLESEKLQKEVRHLEELKKNKKVLKRQKDAVENQLLKCTLTLEEFIKEREKLQITAKTLSDRLEGITAEKDVLIDQFNKTTEAIGNYNKNIENLKAEIHDIRLVISNNTIPVHSITESCRL